MDVPVLFLTFNRPQHSRQVLESIRKAKPTKLYFHNDGARSGRPEEAKACDEVRNLSKEIDWPCEVFTWFRDDNVGCKLGVSSAITWFFEREEMGIILEDDCLPEPSFFTYCSELLYKYRDREDIFMISGNHFLPNKYLKSKDDYYFTQYAFIWGWASWRRAWDKYSLSNADTNKPKFAVPIGQIVSNAFSIYYLADKFRNAFSNKIDSWDFQWFYTLLLHNGKCINPRVHLVTNIGIGMESTHTVSVNKYLHIKTGSLPAHLNYSGTEEIIPLQQSQVIFDRVYKSKWKGFLWYLKQRLFGR